MPRRRKNEETVILIKPKNDRKQGYGKTLQFSKDVNNTEIASNIQGVSLLLNGGDPDQVGLLERHSGIPKNENNDTHSDLTQAYARQHFKNSIDQLTDGQFIELAQILSTSPLADVFQTHVGESTPAREPGGPDERADSYVILDDGIEVSVDEQGLPIEAPHVWGAEPDNELSPADFIKRYYGPWIGKGLSRARIAKLDFKLAEAYSSWIRPSRHPEDRLPLVHGRPGRRAGTRFPEGYRSTQRSARPK
ncbi:MAG: hypothetical protein AAF234_06545 [Pseudomonadota bacterium]